MRCLTSAAILAACPAVPSCATPQQRAESRENLPAAAAGFTVQPASTPQGIASLRSLPPNRLVQRTRGDTVRYTYADPLVSACLCVGDQAAYGCYCQEMFQRRLADEQAMTAQMNQTAWDDGPWGPL